MPFILPGPVLPQQLKPQSCTQPGQGQGPTERNEAQIPLKVSIHSRAGLPETGEQGNGRKTCRGESSDFTHERHNSASPRCGRDTALSLGTERNQIAKALPCTPGDCTHHHRFYRRQPQHLNPSPTAVWGAESCVLRQEPHLLDSDGAVACPQKNERVTWRAADTPLGGQRMRGCNREGKRSPAPLKH